MDQMPDSIPASQFVEDPGQPAPPQVSQPQNVQPQGMPDTIPASQFVDDQGKFGTLPQQALTGAEGVAKGVLGPVATLGERVLSNAGIPGLSPQAQIAREQANPITSVVGETAGFLGSALTGTGEAALLGKAGEAAAPLAEAMGIGGTGTLAKIGSSAVKGAVENALFQAGDETSKLIQGRPNDLIETAIPNMGLSAAIGGAFGAGAGGVSALWKSTAGTKTGALLNALSERLGGIEGVEGSPVGEMVSKTGMNIAPEVQAGLSQDPAVQEMFNTLNQSDTTNSGKEFQKSLSDFKNQTGKTVAETLGRNVEDVPDQFDKYTAGKTIGDTLADEFQTKVEPLAEKYEAIQSKYADAPLIPSVADQEPVLAPKIADAESQVASLTKQVGEYGRPPEEQLGLSEQLIQAESNLADLKRQATTPGTVDMLQDKIAQLAQGERWTLSPSSDIMGQVNRVVKELPNIKNVSDLSAYIQRVGENMQSDPMNGPLRRAGGMIKDVLRDAESELIGAHLGEKEGPEALANYRGVQKDWAQVSKLKEALDDRLNVKGSVSSFAKNLKQMTNSEGESVFRKLSGGNDANLLQVLGEHFPETAQALREAHVDQLLSSAKQGDQIVAGKALTNLNKLSPQLQGFLVPEQASQRLEAIGQVLEKLKDTNYNFSNTARTLDKLMQYVPGSSVGLVSMLLGHNPALAFMLGGLTKYVSKDAPDAVRLGLLKWLGSSKPIEPGAFKSMVDLIHNGVKGQNLMSQASRAFVSGAGKVLPERMMPTSEQSKSLDDKLKNMQHPSQFDGISDGVSYYMPDHGIAGAQVAANASTLLNSMRPSQIQNSPLDPVIEPSQLQKDKFDKALTVAEQPLMLLHLANEGCLTQAEVNLGHALYPGFMQKMQSQLTDDLTDHMAKGNTLAQDKQIALSKLLGQPLVSGLKPERIAQTQGVYSQVEQRFQNQQAGQVKASKTGMEKMKVANRVSLSNQSDEA